MSESAERFTKATTRQKAGKSCCFPLPGAVNSPVPNRCALLITVIGSLRLTMSSQLSARPVDVRASVDTVAAVIDSRRRKGCVSFLISFSPVPRSLLHHRRFADGVRDQ